MAASRVQCYKCTGWGNPSEMNIGDGYPARPCDVPPRVYRHADAGICAANEERAKRADMCNYVKCENCGTLIYRGDANRRSWVEYGYFDNGIYERYSCKDKDECRERGNAQEAARRQERIAKLGRIIQQGELARKELAAMGGKGDV